MNDFGWSADDMQAGLALCIGDGWDQLAAVDAVVGAMCAGLTLDEFTLFFLETRDALARGERSGVVSTGFHDYAWNLKVSA